MTFNAPTMLEPFPSWPRFEPDEIQAVSDVLNSGRVNYWTGDTCREFERDFSLFSGLPHAIALANGSLALELALIALEIPPGSEVITTPRTFIASASAAFLRGCVPVLADLDPNSGNLSPEAIQKVITPRTRAIIPVHLGGWPCNMDAIMAIARAHNLKVIEDCAQAMGATYKGRPVGSLGDAAVFSFCQDKIVTTGGEGGMLLLREREAWSRAWSYKDHGKSWDAVHHQSHPPGYRWLHESFGSNWRMTEMQAAIGRIQIRKLPRWLEIRRDNMSRLLGRLEACPGLRVPTCGDDLGHAAYRATVYLRPERLKSGWDRLRILAAMAEAKVPCFSGPCGEIYRELAFVNAGLGPLEPLPVAQALGETSLQFLVHPTLGPEHIDRLLSVFLPIMEEATVAPGTGSEDRLLDESND